MNKLRDGHRYNLEGFFRDGGGAKQRSKRAAKKVKPSGEIHTAALLKNINVVSDLFDSFYVWFSDKVIGKCEMRLYVALLYTFRPVL